ncbi:MAG: peptidyl-prolyl cis-trans isomerase [Candidatus Cloacimonadaceae bacterium]|jgi:peptidyl-prolyl cis-trans isomerase C|nr:peptidyl-prolyl cis-trans isomerase [Candidatus Cloacimonadota bacterium]
MHLKKWFTVITIALLALTTNFADNLTTTEVSNNNRINESDILAEFDGGVITRADLEKRISHLPPNMQGRYKTIEGQKQVLDAIAMEEVFAAKAMQLKLNEDPEVVANIETAKKQFLIQEFYKRNITDLVVVTDEDKQRYYEENKKIFYINPNITANIIQLSDEETAQQAVQELRSGKSFEEVSNLYNINNYIKSLKSVVRNIRLNGNIPGIGNDYELEDLIAKAQPDTTAILGPYKTTTGWYVFRVVDHQPGYQKTYEEVYSELEQRVKPVVEARLLNDLMTNLKAKYAVIVDSTIVTQIDLRNPSQNKDIEEQVLVTASAPELTITVKTLLDSFSKLSPQEQLFYSKGGGAKQFLDQELIRNLLYLEAKNQNYEEYIKDDENYQQMQRYYLLQKAYKILVVDSINISSEDTRAYFEAHIQDFTNPSYRTIQVLWFNDEQTAESVRKLYALYTAFDDTTRINNLIETKSTRPNLSILDHIYNNGIITGIGPDKDFCDMVWNNPVGYISPVFKTARGDIVFFQIISETPAQVKSFTEVEPSIYNILRKERQMAQQEKVIQELYEEFNMVLHPERITLQVTADEFFKMADNAAKSRNFNDTIAIYDQIIQHYPNGSDDYRASFMKAFIIAEELKDEDYALQLFKDFLKKYPQGDLNESAQFMIDSLEGKIKLEFEE